MLLTEVFNAILFRVEESAFHRIGQDKNGRLNICEEVKPDSIFVHEVSGTFDDGIQRRDPRTRVRAEWTFQLRLGFSTMVSMECFKNNLQDLRVARDVDHEIPEVFINVLDFIVEHPVEVQGSAGGTQAVFTFNAAVQRRI